VILVAGAILHRAVAPVGLTARIAAPDADRMHQRRGGLAGFSDLSELAPAFTKQAFQGPTNALDQGLKLRKRKRTIKIVLHTFVPIRHTLRICD
jgi:hypothetical protein